MSQSHNTTSRLRCRAAFAPDQEAPRLFSGRPATLCQTPRPSTSRASVTARTCGWSSTPRWREGRCCRRCCGPRMSRGTRRLQCASPRASRPWRSRGCRAAGWARRRKGCSTPRRRSSPPEPPSWLLRARTASAPWFLPREAPPSSDRSSRFLSRCERPRARAQVKGRPVCAFVRCASNASLDACWILFV